VFVEDPYLFIIGIAGFPDIGFAPYPLEELPPIAPKL